MSNVSLTPNLRRARPIKSPHGDGCIDPLPNGTFRVRFRLDGRRQSRTFATFDAAECYRSAFAQNQGATGATAARLSKSLLEWGDEWFEAREREGIEDIATDISRWKTHIKCAPFANLPPRDIRRIAIKRWVVELQNKLISEVTRRSPKKLARQTVRNILNLLRCCLAGAVEAGLLEDNPAEGIKVKREKRTRDPWTHLSAVEQQQIMTCDGIPELARLWIVFLFGTCIRLGEFNNLELEDVHAFDPDPHIIVRFGKKDGSTKGNEIRRVALFGWALAAIRRWLEILPTYCPRNPLGLAFPGPSGARRSRGKFLEKSVRKKGVKRSLNKVMKVNLFHQYLRLAGIHRPVRHHDLRHTGASSLVGGSWGESWTLEEVKEQLGHKSVTTTERYAHFAEDIAGRAARRMAAVALPPVQERSAASQLRSPARKGPIPLMTPEALGEALNDRRWAADGSRDGSRGVASNDVTT